MADYLEVWTGGRQELVSLEGERATAGRAETNDVVLADERVSRVHAAFERVAGEWLVRAGWALAYTRMSHDYEADEKAAREAKAGARSIRTPEVIHWCSVRDAASHKFGTRLSADGIA